ncbi:MAG: transcription antitermination factor NusB [bacterium]|jgi:transcription antitermination protein NusB|nr:transcription antitermination factor NusB [bacterium]
MTKSRHRAREVCLQALYWTESSGDPIQQTVHTMSIRSGLSESASEFAAELAKVVWANRESMDREIESVLQNWSLDRVARIDKILLRMALAEMHHFKDIPVKVSIDEAIDLAKRYSEAKASGFINGILDALVKKIP